MRKVMIVGALMGLLGTLGVVQAQAAPGPNGSNNGGLCTAYFNGQKNGHDKHGSPGPFRALEDAAGADRSEDDGDPADTQEQIAAKVYEFCAGMIKGNMEHGRYDCTDPSSDAGDATCTHTDPPNSSSNGASSTKGGGKKPS